MSANPADDFALLRAARPRWVPRAPPGPVDPGLAAELVERLRGAPARAAQLVAGLDDDAQRHRAAPDTWSLRQHVGHLADLEPLWVARTRELLDGAAALSPADVQNPRTWAADFHARPAAELLGVFRGRRAAWTSWLATQPPSAFARSAHHARLDAPFSLAQLCRFVADHDDDHLTEVRALALSASSGVRVRALAADEWPRFVALNRAWIEAHWQLEPSDHALFDAGLPASAGEPDGAAFLAAERGGEVVGVVALLPVRGAALALWPALSDAAPRHATTSSAGVSPGGTWELAKLAVDPRAQRRGVGRALVDALLGAAQARGARRVVLQSARRLVPALALYRAFGFESLGDAAGCAATARCDVRMQLDLGCWP